MHLHLFLESQTKSAVEETKTKTTASAEESKNVITAKSSQVTPGTPTKETPDAVEKMDIDSGTTESEPSKIQSRNTSTENTSNVPKSSKVEQQTVKETNGSILAAKDVAKTAVEAVGTSVKTNLANAAATPVTKVVTVSSSEDTQSTSVQNTTPAVGNTKLVSAAVGIKSQSNVLVKNSPVQTVTLVSGAKAKSASPLVKSAASPRVVPNQVKMPGVSLSTNAVAYNGLSSVTTVNKSIGLKTEEGKKEPPLFKLGMEKSYEQYVNQFSTNQLAKNKQHAQEERDRRRGISTKFNLAEYNYTGSLIGNLERILLTLRCSIVTLETSIPTAFMHPMWPVQRSTWVKAVHMSKTAPEFASVLSFFEGFIKPVVMRGVWNDAVGHLEFFRNLTESKTAGTKKTVKDEEEEHRNIELIGKL